MFTRSFGIAGWLCVIAFASVTVGQAQSQEVAGILKSVDIGANTITVAITEGGGRGEERRDPVTTEKTYMLAKQVEVVAGAGRGNGRGERGGLYKEAKVADLAAGIRVGLTLSTDQKSVEAIVAEGPTIHGKLKAVDADKNTLTITIATSGNGGERGRDGGREAITEEDKSYALTPDAEIALDDGRGSRFSIKEATLAGLPKNALVTVQLFVDMKKVQAVIAEGPTHSGTVKAVDAAKGTMTLVSQGRSEDNGEELSLVLSSSAVVLVDDGKGRRLSLKQGKLADVPVGAAVTVKMSPDQVGIMSLRAEGATLSGQLRSVDSAKGTIVVAVPKGGRGEDADERTLTVAKDVRITVDGKEAKLDDLKTGENPTVAIRLSLDSQSAQSVTVRAPGERR
jgi:hypothetical protein